MVDSVEVGSEVAARAAGRLEAAMATVEVVRAEVVRAARWATRN